MVKAEARGVEHDARKRPAFVAMDNFSVGAVAQDRVTDKRKVNANLVRASGVKDTTQKSGSVPEFFFDKPVRTCRLTVFAHSHFHAITRVAVNRFANDAGKEVRSLIHEGDILLLEFPRLKLLDESVVSFVGLREKHDAGGFLVEAVDDSGAQLSAGSRKLALSVVEQRVDKGIIAGAGSGMRNDARVFIDDDDVFVFEKDIERDFGRRKRGFRRLGESDFEGIVFGKRGLTGDDMAVHAHAAGIQYFLNAGTAHFGECCGEHLVGALVASPGGNGENFRRFGVVFHD